MGGVKLCSSDETGRHLEMVETWPGASSDVRWGGGLVFSVAGKMLLRDGASKAALVILGWKACAILRYVAQHAAQVGMAGAGADAGHGLVRAESTPARRSWFSRRLGRRTNGIDGIRCRCRGNCVSGLPQGGWGRGGPRTVLGEGVGVCWRH